MRWVLAIAATMLLACTEQAPESAASNSSDLAGAADVSGALNITGVPNISGTWSDPPPRAEDHFCHIGCLIEARDHLTTLLNDPALFDKTYKELKDQAQDFQIGELLPSYLTQEARDARQNRGPPPVDGTCQPWGLVRMSLAPHALRITQQDDHISFQYSEWTTLRHIYMDGREFPADLENSKYGYSIGRYEDEELVIETKGVISDNFAAGGFVHSDQATLTERFSRIGEDRLEVEVVLTDPVAFTKPLLMARAWGWAPGEEIYSYEKCAVE
jgi:hypothetical protein